FQAITGYYTEDISELSGELPEKLKRALVAPRFLQVWGIAPALGRDFTPEEERFGGPPAVIISDRLWRRRFGANPNAIGKVLRVGLISSPIIGVMPAAFHFPDRDVDLWRPSPMDAPYAQSRESTWFTTVGRLKPGVTLAQARADLTNVQANLGRQYPKTDAVLSALIEPLKEKTVAGVRNSLWILFGSVSVLLLIACTNIAALLLSRGADRGHEVSLRLSLGASRTSVAARLLAEVLILSLAGASLGLLVAAGASRVFRTLAQDLPRIDEIGLDGRIVLYSLVCAVAATLVCGILPAIRVSRQDPAVSLARAGRSRIGGRNPVQFVLVGVQVALAVTLLVGAGLLLRSFQELGRVSPGFDPDRVLTFRISITWGETSDQNAARQRVDRILDGLRAVPGVRAVATALGFPGVPTQYPIELRTLEGRAGTEPPMVAEGRVVSPGYFETMRIPVVAGELCREQSKVTGLMVNRSFAETYFGGSGAIGRQLKQSANPSPLPQTIQGIVGDARETGLDRTPVPTAYWCVAAIQPGSIFLVRTQGAPNSMVETIRRKMHEIEPRRAVYEITPLTDHVSDAYAENRLRTILLAFFAVSAVSLACVGLYGTLSYLVSVRRREVGLRMALGAVRGGIVRNFLAQGLLVAVIGCVAGSALAVLSGRFLSGMLYGVSATDPLTMAGVMAIVLFVSALASLLPAMRAARLDPMEVLRDE
ncbi:MAG: ABC transporter permease, partial [Bryobacteraceae bacterium]